MERTELTRAVHIVGKNFLGLRADVLLEPTKQPGWWWQTGKREVPLYDCTAQTSIDGLTLCFEDKKLHAVEPLLVLRCMGLDNVCISSQSGRFPFAGSSALFWEQVQPALKKSGELEPYLLPRAVIGVGLRTLRTEPSTKPLRVSAYIEYSPREKAKYNFSFGLDSSVLSARRIWPWKSFLAHVAAGALWPHKKEFLYPKKTDANKKLLMESAQRRVLDILGALALIIPPRGMLCGQVQSTRTGRSEDLELLHQCSGRLQPLHVAQETRV